MPEPIPSGQLPRIFFNTNFPRGVEFSNTGNGFLVSRQRGQFDSPACRFPRGCGRLAHQRTLTAGPTAISGDGYDVSLVPGNGKLRANGTSGRRVDL